jgi:hypothetical protein
VGDPAPAGDDAVRDATGPRCATHQAVEAVTTCKRCGGFMCEPCTLHGTEDRCSTCRPRRTREEREERRLNAVRRSPWVRCEACGYLGPRFDKAGPPEGAEWFTVILAPVFLCVIGFAIALQQALAGFPKTRCPACDGSAELWPAPEASGPVPAAFVEATERQRREWFGRRWVGLVAVTLLGPVVLFLLAMTFVSSR